jgi:hypothetical protein
MVDNNFLKLLGQSKEEYTKYLENGVSDDLAEAGELLWECLKADIVQAANMKIDNVNALKLAVIKRGEAYNQLFYQCYHFHSWYVGGVPNDFVMEEKLYLKTIKSLEALLKNRANGRRAKHAMENAVAAI